MVYKTVRKKFTLKFQELMMDSDPNYIALALNSNQRLQAKQF